MTYQEALNNLCDTYEKKYSFPRSEIASMLKSGINEYDLTVNAAYNGLRMFLGEHFNEPEYFSSFDMAEMLDCTHEEIVEKIQECKEELIAQGKNPDDYFKEPEPIAKFYFPNGLKL